MKMKMKIENNKIMWKKLMREMGKWMIMINV